MTRSFCIGLESKVILRMKRATMDRLMEFVSEQEDADGERYLERMRVLDSPITEPMAAGDTLDLWKEHPGHATRDVEAALGLLETLLAEHGATWSCDADWAALDATPVELRATIAAAREACRRVEADRLYSWVE